jgi:protein arginine N-methyltransferase 1
VYAVEATYMALHARTLVAGNGLSDKIEVIQAAMEDVELPEKVDVIVSEWMGYFLLRESMLDSVIVARDKWLKPGGAMFPSHATLYIAPSYVNMIPSLPTQPRVRGCILGCRSRLSREPPPH